MKRLILRKLIPWLTLGFGLVGLLLRLTMYDRCIDGRDLLIRDNPYHLVTWGLTVLVALVLIPALRPLDGPNDYRYNFWPSIPAAGAALLAAGGLFVTAVQADFYPLDTLTMLWRGAAFLASAALAIIGICRGLGKRPFFLLYAMVSAFFALHLANQYRIWSGNPQSPDYSFQLLACIFIMLFAYHQTAFAADTGKRRGQLFAGLMGAYLCCLAVARTDTLWLYPGCGLWLLADLCTLTPPRRRHTEQTADGEQPSEEVA